MKDTLIAIIFKKALFRVLFRVINVIFLINSLTFNAYAQKEGAVWYFGDYAGLDFNQNNPTPLTDGQINTREGVATICDRDGKLLFYTDGATVYNRDHGVMQNGMNLFGNTSSTQSSIVVPWPGSATKFYIFTVDKASKTRNDPNYHGLCYSIVDLTNQPLGRVTNRNTQLPNTSGILFTEKIAVVKHSDKSSYWIIAHEFGSANFYEFRLSAASLAAPIIKPAGSLHEIDDSDPQNRGATGYLKSSPKGDFLAVAVEGLKFFELFTFDNETGIIGLIAKLPTGGDALTPLYNENAYGVEFSPTSTFLYGSTRKNGILYQWDLSAGDKNSIINSVQILRQNIDGLCGALQLGLNGKIYVSLSGRAYLGVINSPIQKNCNYIEHGVSLLDSTGTVKGGKAYFGLPTILSDYFKGADFYCENTCQNDTTRFYLSADRSTIIGMPSWEIYNETGTTLIDAVKVNPVTLEGAYLFTRAGLYLIRFQVNQSGVTVKQEQLISIQPIRPIYLPDTISICKGSPAHLDAGEGASYSWSNDFGLDVGRYQDLYTAGIITVTVTNYNGCRNTDSTLIVVKPLPVLEGTDITKASYGVANGSITLNMAKDDTYDFNWVQFPGQNSNQLLNLPFGTYDLAITSKTTGCTLQIDSLLVDSEWIIPNAFSPNGGTRNEKWVIRILDYRQDCQVQVFDRSGKLVFIDEGSYDPWDGTYLNQGKKLPAGTYFYQIQIDRKDPNTPPERGTVTILR
jgi:gliding motility-associated-like protein